MNHITILVPDNGLDTVTRMMLDEVAKEPDITVIVAGPGEAERYGGNGADTSYDTADTGRVYGVDAVRIRSKLDRKAIRDYRRVMREHGVTMTFSPSTSGLATMLWSSAGLKIRNIGYRGTQARVRRTDPTNYLALLNPRVRHVICETPDIEEYMAGRIGRRHVSGFCKPYELSWVEDAMAHPKRIDGWCGDTFNIITIGMFERRPHKGLRQLVEAMTMLGDRDVTLTVIGSYDEALRDAAPAGKVHFCGPQPGAVAYIPGYDLYVLSSLRDASPRVVREAQACGVPCVVTDIPGARDLIIDGKTGLLVRPDDPRAIADAICTLYDDRDMLRRLAGATRPYIRDNYALAPYVHYFVELFRRQAAE